MSEVVKRRGRPPKLYQNILNESVQKKMCDLLREGHYIESAAALCGVDRANVHKWLKAGARGEDPLYMAFHADVDKAVAEAERNALSIVRDAGKTQWQAAAWYLERRHPFKWGKRTQVEANVNTTSTEVSLQIQVAESELEQRLLEDPESADLLRQLWRRQHPTQINARALEIPQADEL